MIQPLHGVEDRAEAQALLRTAIRRARSHRSLLMLVVICVPVGVASSLVRDVVNAPTVVGYAPHVLFLVPPLAVF